MATLNDGDLCRETLRRWSEAGWIRVAPHSPLTALPGPAFSPQLTLSEFCGRAFEEPPEGDVGESEPRAEAAAEEQEKDEMNDEHS
ncbi:MAG TPA: hypothetical protein VIB08_09355 [Thermoanaerobaculia bacterium]|jgi:hypothetical protein